MLKSGVGHLQDILESLKLDMTNTSAEQDEVMSSATFVSTSSMNINDGKKKKTNIKVDLITEENVVYKLQDYQRLIAHLLIALNRPNTIPSLYVPLNPNGYASTQQQQGGGNKFKGTLVSDDDHKHSVNGSSSDINSQLAPSAASTGQTSTIQAIEENIEDYMTKANYGHGRTAYHQSSDLDDVPTSLDNKLANKTAYLTLTNGGDANADDGDRRLSVLAGDNLATATAIGQVGKGIEFN